MVRLKSMERRGQSLLELLVVIGVIAVVGTVGAQVFYVGARTQKISAERESGLRLIEESFEAARNVADADWQNMVNLTKGTTQYHPEVSAGAWTIASASENVVLNGITYTRFLTIQNVCRDASTRDITGATDTSGGATTCTGSGGAYDASTQQVTAAVAWSGETLSLIQYVTRWQNRACAQASWDTVGAGPVTGCTTTLYDSATGLSTGAALQIQ